jgi:hypothetical protein
MALRFDHFKLWCGCGTGAKDRNLIPMTPRLSGTPFCLMCIAAPFFRGISLMESYPHVSNRYELAWQRIWRKGIALVGDEEIYFEYLESAELIVLPL